MRGLDIGEISNDVKKFPSKHIIFLPSFPLTFEGITTYNLRYLYLSISKTFSG